jgi:hypothetical protein
MKLTIGSFDSTPVNLTIPIALRHQGWELSQQRHTQANQWQGYLNYVCLAVCLPWLSANFRGVNAGDFDPLARGAQQWVAPSFWEVVDGSIVTIDRSRICLLPHTSCDRSELRVPREWMEIPTWIADYYWAVQIDMDAHFVTIWGSATHAQIQTSGGYDGLDRHYYIDADDLLLSSSAPTRGKVAPLKTVAIDRADRYLLEWSRPQLAIPRLEIIEANFDDWLALIAHNSWRLELFRRRLGLNG